MKKAAAVSAVLVLAVSLVSMVFAAEAKKGTIRGIDEKAGTILFCPEGTTSDMTLAVDKSVDLKNVKPGTNAQVSIEKIGGKETVKSIEVMKAAPRRPAVGC